MSARLDLVGQRFGRWTVIEFAGVARRGQSLWRARCDCGTERTVRGHNLRDGDDGMKKTPPVLDAIADVVLAYRPKSKVKKPRKRKKAKRG